ncbi:hypothetical protein OAQ34_02600 [Opitutales bacterium]|jgi:hypothetical protein|nr:hypothetical protein [Opitutales bacterium]
MSFLDDLDQYKPKSAGPAVKPTQATHSNISQPVSGGGSSLPLDAGDGDPRFDPRTGAKLVKGKIRNNDGTGVITIDYNPKTGGVFLDKGELLALSKVKEVRSTLENLLSQQTS